MLQTFVVDIVVRHVCQVAFYQQGAALARRQWSNYTRNPGNALARFIVGTMLGTLVGAVFFRMEVSHIHKAVSSMIPKDMFLFVQGSFCLKRRETLLHLFVSLIYDLSLCS